MNRYINVLIAAVVICLVYQSTMYAAGVKKEVKKGNLLYNKGKFEDALKHYERALAKAPDSDVVNFDTAAALYKTKQFEAAARHFEKALLSDDESLQQKAQYNLGNAQYKYGIGFENTELEKAVSLLEQSLSHYERALSIDPKDEDARFNRDFVEKELERLKEKLQKQQSEQKQEQQQKQEQSSQQQVSLQAQEQQKQAQEQSQKGSSSQKESEQKERSSQQAGAMKGQPMSEQEARMLLRGYRQEEEPQGLYQERRPIGEVPAPEKDW